MGVASVYDADLSLRVRLLASAREGVRERLGGFGRESAKERELAGHVQAEQHHEQTGRKHHPAPDARKIECGTDGTQNHTDDHIREYLGRLVDQVRREARADGPLEPSLTA